MQPHTGQRICMCKNLKRLMVKLNLCLISWSRWISQWWKCNFSSSLLVSISSKTLCWCDDESLLSPGEAPHSQTSLSDLRSHLSLEFASSVLANFTITLVPQNYLCFVLNNSEFEDLLLYSILLLYQPWTRRACMQTL